MNNIAVNASIVGSTSMTESHRYKQALDQIPPFDNEDLYMFLITFERLVTVHNYTHDMWAGLLITKLRGKTLVAINLLSNSEMKVCDST